MFSVFLTSGLLGGILRAWSTMRIRLYLRIFLLVNQIFSVTTCVTQSVEWSVIISSLMHAVCSKVSPECRLSFYSLLKSLSMGAGLLYCLRESISPRPSTLHCRDMNAYGTGDSKCCTPRKYRIHSPSFVFSKLITADLISWLAWKPNSSIWFAVWQL